MGNRLNNNVRLVMRRDAKPIFLTGKDGVLSLPTYVDFRRGAQDEAERASGTAVVYPPQPPEWSGIPAGRPRSLWPVAVFLIVFWGYFGWLAFA